MLLFLIFNKNYYIIFIEKGKEKKIINMIKIICTTKREKEDIMKTIGKSANCPLPGVACSDSYSCRKCVEKNISWEVLEKEESQ